MSDSGAPVRRCVAFTADPSHNFDSRRCFLFEGGSRRAHRANAFAQEANRRVHRSEHQHPHLNAARGSLHAARRRRRDLPGRLGRALGTAASRCAPQHPSTRPWRSPRRTPRSTQSSICGCPAREGWDAPRAEAVDAGTRSVVLTGYGSIAGGRSRAPRRQFHPEAADADDVVAAFEKYERGDPWTDRSSRRPTARPRSPAWNGSTSSVFSRTAAATSPSPPVASGSTAAHPGNDVTLRKSAPPGTGFGGGLVGDPFPRADTVQGAGLRRPPASLLRRVAAAAGRDKVRGVSSSASDDDRPIP